MSDVINDIRDGLRTINDETGDWPELNERETNLLSDLYDSPPDIRKLILTHILPDISNKDKVVESMQTIVEIPWLSARANLGLLLGAKKLKKELKEKFDANLGRYMKPKMITEWDPDGGDDFVLNTGLRLLPERLTRDIKNYSIIKKLTDQGESYYQVVFTIGHHLADIGIQRNLNGKWRKELLKSGKIAQRSDNYYTSYSDQPFHIVKWAKDIAGLFAAYESISDYTEPEEREQKRIVKALEKKGELRSINHRLGCYDPAVSSIHFPNNPKPNPLSPLIDVYKRGFLIRAADVSIEKVYEGGGYLRNCETANDIILCIRGGREMTIGMDRVRPCY